MSAVNPYIVEDQMPDRDAPANGATARLVSVSVGRMPPRAVARKLAEHEARAHAKSRRRPAEDVGIAIGVIEIRIGVHLDEIELERRIVPGP